MLLNLNLQSEFVPDQKSGQVHGDVTFPVGTPLALTEADARRASRPRRSRFRNVDTVRTYAGTKPDGWGSTDGGFVGTFNVTLREGRTAASRTRSSRGCARSSRRWRRAPRCTISGRGGGGSGLPISFTLSGPAT